jgi:hypothetical protein
MPDPLQTGDLDPRARKTTSLLQKRDLAIFQEDELHLAQGGAPLGAQAQHNLQFHFFPGVSVAWWAKPFQSR